MKKILQVTFIIFLNLIIAGQISAGIFNHQSFTLKNGLKVYFIKNSLAPLINVEVFYKVGTADDPREAHGLSHFVEHLMFRGTKNISKDQLNMILSQQGAEFNAFTSSDLTCYTTRLPADQLELILYIEADRMQNLSFTEEDVKAEKEVVFEERAMRLDNNPFGSAQEIYLRSLYWNHPYSIPPIGYKEHIAAYNFENSLKHYKTYYVPNNAFIVITGDAELEKIKELTEKYFGAIPSKDLPPRQRTQENERSNTTIKIDQDAPRVNLTYLHYSLLAPHFKRNKEEALALIVLTQILADEATGKLFKKFVDGERVASNVSADYKYETLDPMDFSIGITMLPTITPEDMQKKLEDFLKEIVEKGVIEKDLTDAKRDLLSDMAFAKDGLGFAAQAFRSLAADVPVEDIENWDKLIQGVTLEQVNKAAKALFSRKPDVLMVLKPLKKKEAAQAA